jgi:predicted O-methyltransferase YrrM
MFIDADKHNYRTYFEIGLERLSPHGVMIFDNTLWSGKVVQGENDPDTQNMHAFNSHLQQFPDLMVTLLPIRDGLTWVSKRPKKP